MRTLLLIALLFVTPFSLVAQEAATVAGDVIPSQGFSFTSLWRGVLGMASLLLIAYLFSNNRKAIHWKTVGIGLVLQLVIAVGVLKVPFIEKIFDFVGSIFVSVLEFTLAGSDFLFKGLVSDTSTFGYIFAFQVLPTIIFFDNGKPVDTIVGAHSRMEIIERIETLYN